MLDNSEFLPDRLRSFYKIDLNLFVVFAAIFEQGSLTAAGRTLNLTQPAVSHALSRLRTSLGDDLFVRKGGAVVPTPFAKSIIDDVHLALDTFRSGPLGERRFNPSTSTAVFRVSVTASMEVYLLPRILKRLSEEAPNTTIITARVERNDIDDALARGELSLAIDADAPINSHLSCLSLVKDELVTVSRKGNPISKKGIDKEVYLNAKHILVTTRSVDGGTEDYELARLGLRRYIVSRCVNVLAAVNSVAETDYLLTLGSKQLASTGAASQLEVFDFPFEGPQLEALLFWHNNVEKDPANIWLRQIVIDIFS